MSDAGMRMRPSEISRALTAIIPTRQSVLLLGPPGVGKSSVAYQAGARLYNGDSHGSTVTGLKDTPWLCVIRATDRDPVDLRGLPFVRDGQTHWSRPDLLSNLGPDGGIILIEELPQALPAVQCVLRELLLDHRIGGHRIPDGWTVIATGNRQQDRAGAAKLLTHVASSVVVLEMDVNQEDWQQWALQAGIVNEVRSFLNFKPSAMHDFDPSRLINTDPRGWERVSILSRKVPADLLLGVICGCVCQGHAAEFQSFKELCDKLPDPKEVLANPEKGKIPKEPSIIYALTGALVDVVRGSTSTKLLSNLLIYCERLSKEVDRGDAYSVMTVRDALAVAPGLTALAKSTGWLKKNKDLLLGSGIGGN